MFFLFYAFFFHRQDFFLNSTGICELFNPESCIFQQTLKKFDINPVKTSSFLVTFENLDRDDF